MKTFLKIEPVYYLLIAIYIVWMGAYFININKVPFHPDETTQIYMSDDFDLLFSKPSTLFYSKTPNNNPKQTYRFLDAPITRYTIGFWRNVSAQPALRQDWNWSTDWTSNQTALPNPSLLFISRLGVSFVFPFSVILLFLITKRLFSTTAAAIASFLLMSNTVILLHTRRAMAESLMLFFMLLSIWLLYSLKPKHFFLAAIPIAFAINTKQSLLFLIPVAVIILFFNQKFSWMLIKQIILFFLLLLAFTAILNPVLWGHPLEAIPILFMKRANLLESQISVIQSVSPDFILNSPLKRLIGFIAQTFITPPAYQDVANYQVDLQPSIQQYEQIIFHFGIFRSIIPGVILFAFSMIGFVFILLEKQKNKIDFLLLFLFALAEILYVFPIPFQRYYLPLYPFIFIFIAVFLTKMLEGLKQSAARS